MLSCALQVCMGRDLDVIMCITSVQFYINFYDIL